MIRLATPADRNAVVTLVRFEEQVHSHLDWRVVEDWLGTQPFLLAEQGRRAVAALACPPDPPDTAWLRLFVSTERLPQSEMWDMLWARAQAMLIANGVQLAAAISLDGWIDDLCLRVGFTLAHHVVVLNRPRGPVASWERNGVTLRPAHPGDYPAIIITDTAAFAPPWQNSPGLLTHALQRGDYVTVAEMDGQIVGYQLSTLSPVNAHLARLAVRPQWQGQGLGAMLVAHMVNHYQQQGIREITVNTQANNGSSLAVYQRLGFVRTTTQFPVYQRALGT